MIMNECDVSMNSNMIVTMMMINEMSRVHTSKAQANTQNNSKAN